MMNAFTQTTFRRWGRRSRQRDRDEVSRQREEQEQFGGQAMHTLKCGPVASNREKAFRERTRRIEDRRIAVQEQIDRHPKMLKNS